MFASCQKKIDVPADSGSINGDLVTSENALYPEPCHSLSFSTNYPIVAGKTPPFRFTKTQYASGRIKTINMLSRANPNHVAFKQQAWEVIGTFTYWSDKARLVGTKQLWEYYKTATGTAARRSIVKRNIDLTFAFGLGEPYDGTIEGEVKSVFNNVEGKQALRMLRNGAVHNPFEIEVLQGSDEPENYFEAWHEWDGTQDVTIGSNSSSWALRKLIRIKYSPNPRFVEGYRAYQPTQNWISLEYTLCEVMGWVGWHGLDGGDERSSVEVSFHPYNTAYKVVQSQVYKNHRYAGANLLSYTYGDNVLQKTTWLCK